MKSMLTFTITAPAGDTDIPERVARFLCNNLAAYIEQEFRQDFDPTWVLPTWDGMPVGPGPIMVTVTQHAGVIAIATEVKG